MIKSILFLFAVFVLTVVTCKVDSSWDVEKAFKENEITPGRSIEGRLPLKVPPKKFLTVRNSEGQKKENFFINVGVFFFKVFFPNGVKVGLGNNLEPEQVQEKPIVTWDAEEGAYYTLFQIDLDPPSRKFACLGEFRHWLVVNIPGNDVNKGEEVVKYRGSGTYRQHERKYNQLTNIK